MRRFFLLLLAVSPAALAYNEAVHAAITRSVFPAEGALLQPPTQADLDAFRALFFRAAAAADQGFARRYPVFGAWEFKELFMLDPAARVHGFDLTGDEARPLTRGELLQRASRWPDDDGRNRNRFQRDEKTHEVVRAGDGSPMPYDPATLDFGSLSGTTSQGHAHYGLVDGPLSDDPEVLKKDPARFAVPRTAHAWGAELAQLYTDLALLAADSGLPSSQWLSATFAGAAFHHLQDVANQIHTVQVGIYQFFRSAFVQSTLRDVKTLGGLFGERRTLRQVGLRLIANHHLFSEDLFARHLAEIGRDPSLEAPALQRIAAESGQVGLGLAKAIIAESSREAPEVYRLAFTFSAKTLRDGVSGHEYDGARDDPEAFVDTSQEEALQRFYALENRGTARAAQALLLWQRLADGERGAPGLRERAVRRTLALLLPYHAQAAQRRASYQPAPAGRAGIAWGYPLAALALLLALLKFGTPYSFRRRARK